MSGLKPYVKKDKRRKDLGPPEAASDDEARRLSKESSSIPAHSEPPYSYYSQGIPWEAEE